MVFVHIRWELRLAAGEAAIPDPTPARKMQENGKHNHGHQLGAGCGTLSPAGTGILPWPPQNSSLERRSPVLGFILKLFHWSDGEIPKAEQRIVVASRQGQAGSGIKPCLASVERLKCFGRLRKCPFHFSIDWSLLNTHTSASAAFGGFSLGLFSFHFFHDFKCFWQ